jgi:hypothetical protein
MKRKRNVALSDTFDRSVRAISTIASGAGDKRIDGPTINLAAIESACNFLRQKCGYLEQPHSYPSCIAFVKSPQVSKYIFYISTTTPLSTLPVKMLDQEESLYGYLRREREETVTMDHQLSIALKITRAVLQFHQTPWLGSEWTLKQVQLMSTDIGEDFQLFKFKTTCPSGRGVYSIINFKDGN